jgi:NMD protein affecting ribosome stability and mRNA decay
VIMARRPTTPTPLAPQGSTPRYRDRIYDDPRHDPYQAKGKYTDGTICRDCHAVFRRGRWMLGSAPETERLALCPACGRIRDELPAGYVTLEGTLTEADRQLLVRIARNEEARVKAEHPLERIMRVEDDGERVLVTTTDTHLPRRIGEAVKRSLKGKLNVKFGEDEYSVRVHWQR